MQGAMLALALSEVGLTPMVVEQGVLGEGASGNSYGIVHGGLRYLQFLNMWRWLRSKRSQTWFLNQFPAFVSPLQCVMPLYKGCLRSPALFRLAALLEKLLSLVVGVKSPLQTMRIISTDAVEQKFPFLIKPKLNGAACWYDAQINDMPGLIKEVLMRAGVSEGRLLTQTQALSLVMQDNRVTGLMVMDKTNGQVSNIACEKVINCTGAWSEKWQHGCQMPHARTLAFNLCFDVSMQSEHALAISAKPGKGRSYFIRPYQGGTLAGTFYRALEDSGDEATVSSADIQDFIEVLHQAYPGFGFNQAKLLNIYAGVLPSQDESGSQLSSEDLIIKHEVAGFYSVLPSKFTIAPLLAQQAVKKIFGKRVSGVSAWEVASKNV